MKKIHIITYGCQMNEYDSEAMAGLMGRNGFEPTDRPEHADLILLNTCAVREKPEQKVLSKLGELGKLKRDKPELIIGVCGCMAQEWGEDLFQKSRHVDLVCGPGNLGQLPDLYLAARQSGDPVWAVDLSYDGAERAHAAVVRESRISAWVPIMYGCSQHCTFCIVPFTRGREQSRPMAEIVREIQGLADEGYKEVTLLGQIVNRYGTDLGGEGPRLHHLLEAVNEIEGIERIRFTSPHPRCFTPEMVGAIGALPKVCEHVHLPLQSGDATILRLMNRKHTPDDFFALVDLFREKVPGIAISTDIIVGFPGETEEQFQNTLRALERVRFDQAFMFIFSPRRKTAAAKMKNQVDAATKIQRLQELAALQNEMGRQKNEAVVGRCFEVLVEGTSKHEPSRLAGRTRTNKIMVFSPSNGEVAGQFIPVRATRGFLWGFEGLVLGAVEAEVA